jgi:spore germination protein KA
MAEKEIPKRSVMEPPTGSVVYGPREGFIEDVDTNLELIYKRIKKEKLDIKTLKVGSVTESRVVVVSLKGVANTDVVNQIVERIKSIEIDGVIDSYYIQSFLVERPDSIFKQVGICEKPDTLTAKILEGRVAIIVDGSPIVLTLPFILLEDLQASEDYYEEKTKVSFMRIIRLTGVFIALILPALYISFQLFHYKALPLKFLLTILNQSEALPFPPAVEVLMIFILFEILYEASARVPKGMGNSFNILSGLILGGTAVASNLTSASTVMIVAISSIALYLIPEQISVLRLIRFVFMLMAILMGVIGIAIVFVFVLAYLVDFDSFGAAYLAPFTPYISADQKDGILKDSLINQNNTTPKSLNKDVKKR